MTGTSSSPLDHDAAFAELGALAIGALNPDEEQRVREHVETCSICTAEVKAMMSISNAMPAVPSGGTMPADVSQQMRDRLVSRAALSSESARFGTPRRTARLFLIAAGVVIVALGIGYYRESVARREMAVAVARRDSVVSALMVQLSDRNAELAAITGPSVSVVDMTSTGVRPPTARMFWDRATNKWTLFAHGLASPKPGRTYELWLVTADKKIPAGTFTPGSDGSAVVHATYALSPSDLKAIAITDEPAGGVSVPTGAVILAGSAGS